MKSSKVSKKTIDYFLPGKIYLKKKEIHSIQQTLKKLEKLYLAYDFIKLSVASPIKIRKWAQKKTPQGDLVGEVIKPETINFRTYLPELFGLFCEQIFGPITNYRCRCGTYTGALLNKICENCEVEVTEARVRRYRMGYIQFVYPIAHYWYFKGVPNYLLYLSRFLFPRIKSQHIDAFLYYKEGLILYDDLKSIETDYSDDFIDLRFQHFAFKPYGDEILEETYVPSTIVPKIDPHPKAQTFKEFPNFFPFILKGIKRRGILDKYYRDYHLKQRTEANYSQEYSLKVILYTYYKDYEQDREKTLAEELLQKKENDKLIRNYKHRYGSKLGLTILLLGIQKKDVLDKLNYTKKQIKIMLQLIRKFRSKYNYFDEIKNSNNTRNNSLSFLDIISKKEVRKLLSPIDIELLTLPDVYLFEEFPNFTSGIKALLERKRNKKISKYVAMYLQLKSFRKGAQIFQHMLQRMDPYIIMRILRTKLFKMNIRLKENFNQKFALRSKLYCKQFRIFNSFVETQTNPSWIILTALPILPPTLRPFIEINTGRLICSDLNELYRLLIIRNNRLALSIFKYHYPESFSIFNRQIIQQTTDCLINNARVSNYTSVKMNDKPLRGLTEILEGKFGRFRYTLLGKRIDYSGRSVIVVNPQLKLNQCGLPYFISMHIFKPILIKQLISRFLDTTKFDYNNIKKASIILENDFALIWRLLELLMRKSTVLLNRAPTLHKLGIQGFSPLLVLEQGIHLHPLVCTGFNADFDGDQMAIHLPLYKTTQFEVKTLARPSSNILLSSNGELNLKPSQDIVIGCYYLTLMLKSYGIIERYLFANESQVLYALSQKELTIHTPILIRYNFLKFSLTYDNNNLKITSFYSKQNKDLNFFLSEKISVFKIYKNSQKSNKFYFFTNFGIILGKRLNTKLYEVTDYFIETTPGRLLFSTNLKTFSSFKINS